MTTMAVRHVSKRYRSCINPYPCGGQIRPGDTYWAVSIPPGHEPFYAKGWMRIAECDPCHEQRYGMPLVIDERPEPLDNHKEGPRATTKGNTE